MGLTEKSFLERMEYMGFYDSNKIEAIPAADVVARDCYDRLLAENDELRKERPVVRCKDCTHSRKGKESLECEKHRYAWNDRLRWVDDNDFCCWGVRKDGDGE